MPTEQFPDIAKAIRQSNAGSIAALMFDQTGWSIRAGYCTETEYWDYKVTGPSPGAGMPAEWAILAKDVLAFHNNKGGVIVFGVGNGFNVVGYRSQLDSKLLNDRLRKYIGDKIWLDYHRLNIKEDQSHRRKRNGLMNANQNTVELNDLLPVILGRAFKGEL